MHSLRRPIPRQGRRPSTKSTGDSKTELPPRRWIEWRDRILSERTFALYGLDHRWTGTRWVAGAGESDDGIGHIDLAHGGVMDTSGPFVAVDTHPFRQSRFGRTSSPETERGWLTEVATRSLVEWLSATDAAPPQPVDAWDTVALPVATRRTSFRRLVGARCRVAVGAIDDAVLGVRARGVDVEDVHLIAIESVGHCVDNPFA